MTLPYTYFHTHKAAMINNFVVKYFLWSKFCVLEHRSLLVARQMVAASMRDIKIVGDVSKDTHLYVRICNEVLWTVKKFDSVVSMA